LELGGGGVIEREKKYLEKVLKEKLPTKM